MRHAATECPSGSVERFYFHGVFSFYLLAEWDNVGTFLQYMVGFV
jgi:hypothetical protein